MEKIIGLVLISFCLHLSLFGQELLFDGTVEDYKTAVIKPEVQAIFEQQVFPKARKYFKEQAKDETGCEENFEINDGATAISDFEKVYLYTYCSFPESLSSYQGVVVIRNGKVTDHLVFSSINQQYFNIFYKQGLIVIYGSGTKRQSNWGVITTLALANELAEMQRSFWSYSNSCNEDGEKCVETAQKIYAEFNDGYWFSAEEYKKRSGKWIKTKAKKDVTEYNSDQNVDEIVLDDLKELK